MITCAAWSGKRFAVLGLARSGQAAAEALLASGAEVMALQEAGETLSDEQQAILDEPHPDFTENPEGPATIETYTVRHGRKGLQGAVVIGRLEDGTRFIAQTPSDEATLKGLMAERPHYGLLPVAIVGSLFFLFRRWPRFGEPVFLSVNTGLIF